jgi:aminopeptidase C
MKRSVLLIGAMLVSALSCQQKPSPIAAEGAAPQSFTTVMELPITSVKNQYRSGTCWNFATLGYLESEILRKTGKTYDLCEMFVVNKDYMDCAEHYVRMHGYSQISEGGSCDDVIEVIRRHGICPEDAMPAPGSLTGDSLANFKVFFPELERVVSSIVWSGGSRDLNRFTTEEQAPLRNKEPKANWRDSVQTVIDSYVGACPETFEYEGKVFTPQSFAGSLGLDMDDYVSLTSYTHHPFNQWFVIEAPYKWRLKPSYNIPIDRLMTVLDKALDAGYTVAWGGDVSGDFYRKECVAYLEEGVVPTQEMRQEQWDSWEFTYDHVMLIYGKAVDQAGNPYYLVKNSWGKRGQYQGTWYMSRAYIALNTTYIFLNSEALPRGLRREVGR